MAACIREGEAANRRPRTSMTGNRGSGPTPTR